VTFDISSRDAATPHDHLAAIGTGQSVELQLMILASTEAWGVRRFFVRDPHGNVFNIVGHHD